jgi:hypothetical protein
MSRMVHLSGGDHQMPNEEFALYPAVDPRGIQYLRCTHDCNEGSRIG